MELRSFQGSAGLGKSASKFTQVAAGRPHPSLCGPLSACPGVLRTGQRVTRERRERDEPESIPGRCHSLFITDLRSDSPSLLLETNSKTNRNSSQGAGNTHSC